MTVDVRLVGCALLGLGVGTVGVRNHPTLAESREVVLGMLR
jgi:hypothetical protein